MRRGLLALPVLLLAAVPAAAHWEYAIWGMTQAEVIAASRGAARALPEDRQREVQQARMVYRAEARLDEPGLNLDVAFAFDAVTGGLVCVSYVARSAAQATALRDWIIHRFGQPAGTARDPATNEVSTSWRETDNIDMHTMPATRPVVLQCARGT